MSVVFYSLPKAGMMKTIINLLLGAIVVTGLLSSCRKEGSTGPRVWEGRVLEYGSDKPVAGARVYLWEGSSEWWGQSSEYRIDSTESAADGSFRFSYERVGGRYYRITGGADRYYPGEAFLERTSSTKADLVLDPYAWAKFIMYADTTKMYSVKIQDENCHHSFFGDFLEGMNGVVCIKRGNREGHVTVIYNPKRGIGLDQKIISQKVYFPAHDTTLVEVRYED